MHKQSQCKIITNEVPIRTDHICKHRLPKSMEKKGLVCLCPFHLHIKQYFQMSASCPWSNWSVKLLYPAKGRGSSSLLLWFRISALPCDVTINADLHNNSFSTIIKGEECQSAFSGFKRWLLVGAPQPVVTDVYLLYVLKQSPIFQLSVKVVRSNAYCWFSTSLKCSSLSLYMSKPVPLMSE